MRFTTGVALFMALILSNVPYVAMAETAREMIPTSVLVEELSREQARAKIQEQLGREDVKRELGKLGISPDEVSMRMASLSDAELNQMAAQIQQAQYGGFVEILVIVVLVLLIIYLAKRV